MKRLKWLESSNGVLQTSKKVTPQRDTHLSKLRAETSNYKKGVRTFCPTRWTVRGEALASIVNKELIELWDWS